MQHFLSRCSIVPDKFQCHGMIKNIYGIPTGTPYTSISRNQSISPSTRYRYFPSHPINASTVIINTPLYIKFLNVMHPSPLPYILRSPFVKHHQILKLLQSVFYHTHTPYQSSYNLFGQLSSVFCFIFSLSTISQIIDTTTYCSTKCIIGQV